MVAMGIDPIQISDFENQNHISSLFVRYLYATAEMSADMLKRHGQLVERIDDRIQKRLKNNNDDDDSTTNTQQTSKFFFLPERERRECACFARHSAEGRPNSTRLRRHLPILEHFIHSFSQIDFNQQ